MKAVCQNESVWNVLLYDVIVRLSTTSAALDQHQLRHHCLFSSAHRFAYIMFMREVNECTSLCRTQTINMSLKTKHCPVPSCGKNNLCIAFLLIPTFGKSGLTLFLIKYHIASIRITQPFVHLILQQNHLQTRHTSNFFSQKRLKLKDDAVLTILDLTVIPLFYVVVIALFLFTDCLIGIELFMHF